MSERWYYRADPLDDDGRPYGEYTLADRKRGGRFQVDPTDPGGEDSDDNMDEDEDESMDDSDTLDEELDDGDTMDDDKLDDSDELDDSEDFRSPQMKRNGRGGVSPDGMVDGDDFPDESAREDAGGRAKAARYAKWRSSSSKGQPAPAASQQERKLQEEVNAIALSEYGKPVHRLSHAELTEVQLAAAKRTGYRGDDGLDESAELDDAELLEELVAARTENIALREYGKSADRLTHAELTEVQQRAAKMTGY